MTQSADVSQLFKDKPEGNKKISQNKEKEVLDFKATLLEVQKYGMLYPYHSVCVYCCKSMWCGSLVAAVSNLTGKSRRRREEEQVLALGGKVWAITTQSSWSGYSFFSARQAWQDAIPSLSEEDQGTEKERKTRKTGGKNLAYKNNRNSTEGPENQFQHYISLQLLLSGMLVPKKKERTEKKWG